MTVKTSNKIMIINIKGNIPNYFLTFCWHILEKKLKLACCLQRLAWVADVI